jgi:hypothetical protein
MGPTGVVVEVSGRIVSVLLSNLDEVKHLLDGGDLELTGSFDNELLIAVLMDGEGLLFNSRLVGHEEVIDGFIVDLDVGYFDLVLIATGHHPTVPD